MSAVPDLCYIVARRSVESVGGVFDPLLSSAIAAGNRLKRLKVLTSLKVSVFIPL